ncbi:hypothetical protein [Flavobacterium terrigena]|uniref:Uncharacterized protein n=1 Tax=Flavobacterium terrigena TaxID=402734 RepID=A0A1H6SJ92_9FLAO|nr:hypothetical protein [Flavobacterium terrigena]SEI64937.1 hypothetical protein SAMN05660918_1278 [Flavobacterium terrigena]
MKTLKYINTFAIGFPITLLLIGIIINDAAGNWIGFALFSTMLTGLIQVLLGLFLLYKNPKNKHLRIYIISVILFFLLWFINAQINYLNIITFILFPIPLILATYLSLIIYKKLYL